MIPTCFKNLILVFIFLYFSVVPTLLLGHLVVAPMEWLYMSFVIYSASYRLPIY